MKTITVLYNAAVDPGWLQITAWPGMSEGSPVWLVQFNRSWGSKSSKSPAIFTSEWEPDLSIWGDQRWNPRQRTRQIPVAVLADVEAWLRGRTVGKVETPYKSPDTLAVLAAIKDCPTLEAVAEALGTGAYDCHRVWEAWGVGTMGPDDFVPVAEDSDRVAEIADAAIDAIRAIPLPAPQAGEVEA